MDKYKYEVKMLVDIEAFDEADAREMLEDAFGTGETMGVNVTSFEYTEG